ncbi:MAG: WYL domain-containing protein [Lewinellaceae bacterium]|nr:WYL domain-containing protein [Saprospiraceae bacterium]MCB9338989.1 WYL domain-containing protein [Lewinellaceae bacterium]
MAINKNAYIRYQVLDRCFRNPGRKYFWEDLLEACNKALYEYNGAESQIKRRQLFEDIKFMESEQGWAIPLERHPDGKKVYYRYTDLNFSINNQPINEVEAQQLKSAVMVLSRLKGMPQFEWVNELIPRLEQSFGLVNEGKAFMAFDTNEYLKGINWLEDLFHAILHKKVLLIDYQSFRQEQSFHFTIHPYFLRQYNNRWFLFGYNPEFTDISNLALDRIEKMEEIQSPYIENSFVDFEEYFEDIVGVTRPKDGVVEKVQLFFNPSLAPYILTKPLHGSQRKIQQDETGMTVQLEVIPNYELEQLILSYGESVRVLGPVSFREKIKERIIMSTNNYPKG